MWSFRYNSTSSFSFSLPPIMSRHELNFPLTPICDDVSDCCRLSPGNIWGTIWNMISRWSWQSYASCHWFNLLKRYVSLVYNGWANTYKSSTNAVNCSDDDACWEVEQKCTKNSCADIWWGTFRFTTHIFVWVLYCLLWFPETSSLHGITWIQNIGFSSPILRSAFGCG